MLQQNEGSSELPVQLTSSEMVKRLLADFMALLFLDLLFLLSILCFQVLHNFHILR